MRLSALPRSARDRESTTLGIDKAHPPTPRNDYSLPTVDREYVSAKLLARNVTRE